MRGHLFDLDAAFGRGHDGDTSGRAIDQQREVELAGNVAAGFDIDAMNLAPGRSGLLRDQDMADHGFGGGSHLIGRTCDTHATLAVRVIGKMPGAASAGMDLRLHDIDGARKFLAWLPPLHPASRRHGRRAPPHRRASAAPWPGIHGCSSAANRSASSRRRSVRGRCRRIRRTRPSLPGSVRSPPPVRCRRRR